MAKLKREPRVKNKYNLDINKVKKLKIKDRSKVCEPLFWRNNVVSAWCICDCVGKFEDSEYWIGIYDEDAPAYKGQFRFHFTTYSGMCSYNFDRFYDPSEIENDFDLSIQEKFLEKINYLIDNGILEIVE